MTYLSTGGFLSVVICVSLKMVVVTKALHVARRSALHSPAVRASFRFFSLMDRINVDDLDHDLGDLGVGRHSGENSSQGSDGWRKFSFDEVEIRKQSCAPADFRTMEKVDLRPVASPLKPSPVEIVSVRGKQVYIKRDDLLRLERSNVSGNKARKMLALNQIPAKDFPKCVVSYGGSQSNAMLALAAVVQSKNAEATAIINTDGHDGGFDDDVLDEESERLRNVLREKRFVYYTKKLPRFLKKNPSGNYFRAKALGMEVIEVSNDEYSHLFGGDSGGKPDTPADLPIPVSGNSVWIPQGGACGFAVPGCRLLASEILMFWAENGNGRPLSVFVPGGTCSTALILHRELRKMQASSDPSSRMDIDVVVIPCVGDDGYAERQMMALNMETGGTGEKHEIPQVLKPAPMASFYLEGAEKLRYFRFGEPDVDILDSFREMESCGVKIDLLYGAPAWHLLLRHWPVDGDAESCNFLTGREIMYVHSGGLEGINSQLMRYRHRGLVEGNEVQHPERQRRTSKEFFDTRLE